MDKKGKKENTVLENSIAYTLRRRFRKRWSKFVLLMSCLVVFCTTYALILPAITMEKEAFCGKEVHKHDADCQKEEYVCEFKDNHVHSDVCYSQELVLTCGQEETSGHSHSDACYETRQYLICAEAEHFHSDECYAYEENLICDDPSHEHNDGCFEAYPVLICSVPEHTHGDACYQTEKNLICGLDEIPAHTHTDSCYTANKNLTCELPDASDHVHDESCIVKTGCDKEEHEHTLACYSDPTADVENWMQWENTLPNLQGTPAEKAAAAARSQVGYKESKRNYSVIDEAAGIVQGYSRYGAWYAAQTGKPMEYERWNAYFVQFCMHYAGINLPTGDDTYAFLNKLGKETNLIRSCEDFEPQAGDMVFVECDDPAEGMRAAIITAVEGRNMTIVWGDIPGEDGDYVREEQMSMDYERIAYYAQIHQNTEEPVMENPESEIQGEDTVQMDETQAEETVEEVPSGDGVETEQKEDSAAETDEVIEVEEVSIAGVTLLTDDDGDGDDTSNGDNTNEEPVFDAENSIGIENYVVKKSADGTLHTQLLYGKIGDNEGWKVVEENTTIPGDADLHLDVVYENVPIDLLLEYNGLMSYQIPAYMRGVVTSGDIKVGERVVGSVYVRNGYVVIELKKEFLNEQKAQGQVNLSGTFFVESRLDLKKIETTTPGKLEIGDVTIKIAFDDDIVAKYGTVDIEKTIGNDSKFIQDETGDYLEYILTVTAGDDGCPDVKVVDCFNDITFIKEYVGVTGISKDISSVSAVTETVNPDGTGGKVYLGTVTYDDDGELSSISPAGEGAEAPGTLIWEIGDMASNEVRTLTYRVKVQENYVGVQAKTALNNTAEAYSTTYFKDTDTVSFKPKAGLNEKKVSREPVKNEDGSYTIRYTVWAKAYDDNSYTLDNVKIVDSLNHADNQTAAQYLPYLSYNIESFKLYSGNGVNENKRLNTPQNPHKVSEAEGSEHLPNPQLAEDEKGFTYYTGSLAPGQEVTLSYEVTVEPGIFLADNAEEVLVSIHNRAFLYLDDTRTDGQKNHIQAYNCNRDLDKKTWERKLDGVKVQEDSLTIPMPGAIYDATGSEAVPVAEANRPESFTVYKGSYRYNVIVNEAGDWDVSSSSLKDQLGDTHMQFTGYVRVDGYTIETAPSGTDQEVLNTLNGLTPDKTVWVNVDGQSAFDFTPQEIGFDSGSYAVKMTYYAKPVNLTGNEVIIVANTFTLSGTVVKGDFSYILTGIETKGYVTLSRSNYFEAEKKAWYYDAADKSFFETKGMIYWVIQVNAGTIPNGTQLTDYAPTTTDGDRRGNKLYDDVKGAAVVGVYRGSLPEGMESITNYSTYQDAITGCSLTALDKDVDYSIDLGSKGIGGNNGNNNVTIQFLKDISLGEGEEVFVIVGSNPAEVPTGKRKAYYFENSLRHNFLNGTPIFDNDAKFYLDGRDCIQKELGSIFEWDGKTATNIKTGKGGDVFKEWTTADGTTVKLPAGTYVAWASKVNYVGNLKGSYIITDTIPDGMEVAYARIKWLGGDIKDRTDQNVKFSTQIEGLNGWQEHSIRCGTDGDSAGTRTTYYYTNGNEVCWQINHLFPGNNKDTYSVDFQILCRVTDEEALLEGEKKAFNNRISIKDMNGTVLGTDNDQVEIQFNRLSKKGTYDPGVNSGKYPFEIRLNGLGEDLVKGSDTVTLLDVLSDSLKLDVSSLQVYYTDIADSKKEKTLSTERYTVSVDGQTLKIILPDNLPIRITYETFVQAAPGSTVNISNNAHWEGHSAPTTGQVVVKDFSYRAGGTVSTSDLPILKIVKRDSHDANLLLAGAKFKVTEMQLEDDGFTEAANGGVWTDVETGENGTAQIGNQSPYMKWNTVYRIVETAAPIGYAVNSDPYYFTVARMEGGSYPEDLTDYASAGAEIYYLGKEYTYEAYDDSNYKVRLTKHFMDQGKQNVAAIEGEYTFGLYKVQDSKETLVEKKTLTIGSGNTDNTLEFEHLIPGTYKLYELDDSGQKIQKIQGGKTALCGGKLFDVTYDENAVTLDDQHITGEIVVTNRVHYTELPQTGGEGTLLFTAVGCAVIGIAMIGYGFFLLREKRI